MKKFVITEQERKEILEKYSPKKNISEQKTWLTKLFSNSLKKNVNDASKSVDDAFKMYADDAVKSLDDLFAKVYKPGNFKNINGQDVLISAIPTTKPLPLTTIHSLIDNVAKGKISVDKATSFLPRNLADGTEFRNVVHSILSTKGGKVVSGGSQKVASGTQKAAGQASGADYRSQVSQSQSRYGGGSN